MKIALTRKVKAPVREYSSAGTDIFIPDFTQEFVREVGNLNSDAQTMGYIDTQNNFIRIHPHGRFIIPRGIKVEIKPDQVLIAFDKSGVSWGDNNTGRVLLLAKVIDDDYQGEVFVSITNYSAYNTYLRAGQKLTQLLLMPIIKESIEFVSEDQIHLAKTDRGAGALGSSGT